ncbi:MAG TPA: PVC-type heme-binding CxxCH protein, partial [Gemmataceae bacterium]|nr:PVC-type heme-binding CxxCH protein [Gemmataceae bacterium]
SSNIAPTGPRSPQDERKAFHLPPGFEAQLVAAEPDIHKPINLAFDDRGRLWATTTVEYPFPAPEGKVARDCVKILEDFGDDGRARKITTFADKLNIPIGVLPLPGATQALVYSIPDIYRMEDLHGAGHADKREVLYEKYGFKDTHGMTGNFALGFDGWVYACHGFSNTSTVKAGDGSSVTMQSGNVYRLKADGSHVEYFTHGLVNPFGLAFDPLGNLYACDCETRPVYVLLRGAYYPSFGKPDDGLGFGPEMIDHGFGSTAIAGITYYAADHFPAAWRDTLFIGNVVTNRINHAHLVRHGSTYRAVQDKDFLTSDDPWFRPVSVVLGPDGALYVADFYNRIIGHYEVPLDHPGRDRERGRIWRIVYRGKDGKGRPKAPRADWAKATIPELVHDLANPNLVVRMMATHQLVGRGPVATEAVRAVMQPGSSPFQRMHGLWVLQRRGALDDLTLAAAARDPDPGVRVHAQKVLAERSNLPPALRALILAGLKDKDGFVQRAAADALGRHPVPENVRPLLDLRHAVPAADTHLLHTVRMALRDQLLADAAWDRLPVASWSEADARALADVATGVPSARSARFLLEHVARVKEPNDKLERYVHHIARYGSGDAEAKLLAYLRGRTTDDGPQQVALFRALSQGTQERGGALSAAAKSWALELGRHLLASKDGGRIQAGIDLATSLKLEPLQDKLVMLTVPGRATEAQRIAALKALAGIDAKNHVVLLGDLLADTTEAEAVREQAANLLAGINQPDAQEELLGVLPSAPAKLQGAIASGLAGSAAGAEKLLQAVAAGKASARLLQDRAVTIRLVGTKIPKITERLAKLTEGLPPADKRVQELMNHRRAGYRAAKTDPALGAKVFEKSCAICHQVGGKGAKIGPQLDGVGTRGLDRLLEDTLDPNRNVDQAFRSTTLTLKKGQVVSGLLLKEEGAVLVLADAQGKEVRVPKDEVEERAVSQVSPMPANLGDAVPEADFYHLLAYLLKQQQAPPDKNK